MLEHRITPGPAANFDPTHFVGRGVDLERVRAAVHEAVLGTGAALLVGGARGVGKSRFLHECACLETAATHIELHCTGAALLGADLRAQLTDSLVGGTHAAGPDSAAGAFAALMRLLARKPVVLLIDDVHLAEREEWRLLGSLLSLTRRRRLVVLATYLDESAPGSTRGARAWRDAGAMLSTLEPLDRVSMELFVRSLCGADGGASTGVVRRIIDEAQGNPRLAKELVACAARGAPAAALVAPSAELVVALAREDLPAEDFALLQECSAVGDPFCDEWIVAIAEKPRATVAHALQAACNLGLLVEDALNPGWFRFRHAAVRTALGASLVSLKRTLLHERLVSALQAAPSGNGRRDAALAEHLDALGRHEEAAEWLARTGESILAQGDLSAAAHTFARAAKHHAPGSEQWFAVQEQRLTCLRCLDDWSAVTPVLREMLESLGPHPDIERAAGIQFDLFHAHLNACNHEAAQAVAGEIAALHVPGWPDRGAKANLVLAYVLVYAGRTDEARKMVASIDFERLTDPEAQYRHLIATAAIGTMHEPLDRTLALIERAAELAAGRWPRGPVLAYNIGAEEALRFGDIGRCREYLAKSNDVVKYTAGDENGFSRAIARYLALTELTAGNLHAAREQVLPSLGWRDMGRHSHLYFAGLGVTVGMRVGDFALVDALFDPAQLMTGIAGRDADSVSLVVQGFADVMVARGMDKELRAALSRCIDGGLVDAHASIQLCAARFADTDTAERAEQQVIANFGDAIAPVAPAHVALVAAIIARRRGRQAAAFAHGRDAARRYGRLGWRLREAIALEVCGDRGAASAAYSACGALSDVTRLAREQTRKARRAPFGSRLTAREQEVCRLVVRGRSNAEIAHALQISVRTVHHHVEAAFNKLGVRARWQLTSEMLSAVE